ncbi:hypothetical protein GHK33_11960 [Sinorhizobium meliloti]|uniref:Uncharacterized protein n=1 Tax=Rhizobium meliloti TaxID=382 RepID=A0A6A7ZTD0_RHIML|nr:hypothetical protein [Sinorhizobium meliloti]MCO5963855.1 hypothetical protein [Sinorhizobium meliloti]MQW05935.1 hypothetical protein [Sinorhizobium meliloti]MQW63342.1 hypothetical protein [Sinorhizobium meliloti]MQX42941.1 hypothetical protein [Sinorhizobium meliloti]MQX92322.1 hypothetical protein [Sinorhizobium meliloti]
MKDKTRNPSEDKRSLPVKGARKEPDPRQDKAATDPHPGSVSDGTHPEANEVKR